MKPTRQGEKPIMTVVPVEERRRLRGSPAGTGDGPGRAPITTHILAGVSLVRLRGDFDLDSVPGLSAAFESALAVHAWVIVDLDQLGFISSPGLSVLVKAGLVARNNGGDLLVAAPPGFLRSARLATTFSTYDTLSRALTAALRHRSNPPASGR